MTSELESKLLVLGYKIKKLDEDRAIILNSNSGKKEILEIRGDRVTLSDKYDDVIYLGKRDKYIVNSSSGWRITHRGTKQFDGDKYDGITSVHRTSKGIVQIVATIENMYSLVVDENDVSIVPLKMGRTTAYKTRDGVIYETVSYGFTRSIYRETGEQLDLEVVFRKDIDIDILDDRILISESKRDGKFDCMTFDLRGNQLQKFDNCTVARRGSEILLLSKGGIKHYLWYTAETLGL